MSKKWLAVLTIVILLSGCSKNSGVTAAQKAKLARLEAAKTEMEYTVDKPEDYIFAVTTLLEKAESYDEMVAKLEERASLVSNSIIAEYSTLEDLSGIYDDGAPILEGEELDKYLEWLNESLAGDLDNSNSDESESGSNDSNDLESEEIDEEETEISLEGETESEEETEKESESTVSKSIRYIGYVAMAQSGEVVNETETIEKNENNETKEAEIGGNGENISDVLADETDSGEEYSQGGGLLPNGIGGDDIDDELAARRLIDADVTITNCEVYYKMLIMTRLTNYGAVYYKVDLDDNNIIVNITEFR